MEVIVNKKNKEVKILDRDVNKLLVAIDDKKYHLDINKIDNGTYSFINDGKSYNLKIDSTGTDKKKYFVKHLYKSYEVEIVDSEARYRKNRGKNNLDEDQRSISSPMPGKVVKLDVKVGDKVKPGQTLIIISAMKMESEYKAKKEGKVIEILTKEGDTIEGNKPLIILE